MCFTYKTKQTMKQFTRLALPAALLAMAATPSYAFDFTGLNVSDFATPEQATASLKQAGFNIDDLKAYEKLANGDPMTVSFPYKNAAGEETLKTYTFTSIADLKAQALQIAKDYKKATQIDPTFKLKEITGKVALPNGSVVEFTDKPGSKNSKPVLYSKDILALNGSLSTKELKERASTVVSQVNSSGLGNKSGNPASHISQVSYYDSILDNNGVAAGNLSGTDAKSGFSSSFRFANYNYGNADAQLYTVNFGYNWEMGNGLGVLFNMPLTYVDTNNGLSTKESYRLSMGAGVRLPVSRYLNLGALKWDVIPLVRIGGVGLGSGLENNTSIAYSGGVQSNMGGTLGNGFSLIIQNQYTYNTDASEFKVFGLTPKDVNVHVYRNGLQINKETGAQLFGKPLSAGFSFADVRFDSNMGGLDNQQEFGFNFGLKGNGAAANLLKLNVTYTNADGYNDAVAVSVGGTY